MAKVTKNDIVDAIYVKTGYERRQVKAIFELVLNEIKGALVSGQTVELRRFGTFEVRTRRGRRDARNPRTGEAVSVAAHGVAAFKPGQEIRLAVWPLAGPAVDAAADEAAGADGPDADAPPREAPPE